MLAEQVSGSARWAGLGGTFQILGAAVIAIPMSRLMAARGRRPGLAQKHAGGADQRLWQWRQPRQMLLDLAVGQPPDLAQQHAVIEHPGRVHDRGERIASRDRPNDESARSSRLLRSAQWLFRSARWLFRSAAR